MKNMKKAALFGGTLMAAGLSAQAQPEFTLPGNVPPYNDTALDAYVYDYYAIGTTALGGYVLNSGFGTSYSYSNAYGSASASISSTLLTANADASGNTDQYGFVFATAYGYLGVTEDAQIRFTWDFRSAGSDFGPDSTGVLFEFTSGGTELFQAAPGTAGTQLVDVFAGDQYALFLRAVAGQDDTAFARAELIPSPGAAALLGLAGVAGLRRRR